jgi:tetratricopeptide (TPR) repeat protein
MHSSWQNSLRFDWLVGCVTACLLFFFVGDLHAFQNQNADAGREAARLNNIGTALMSQQQLESAAEKFSEAYQLASSLSLAKTNQGIAMLYLQRLPEAQKALELATAQSPNDPHAWYALALLYRNQNESLKAVEALKKVLAIDPFDADTLYLLGSLQMELHDLPASVAEFQKALKINPLHASAQFGLARALQREGKVDEARVALDRFQHIATAKLGAPMSHIYGDEGKYGRVEDASIEDPKVAAMIPVVFTEEWRSAAPAVNVGAPPASSAGACLINLQDKGPSDLVVMGNGEQAVHIFRNTGVGGFEVLPEQQTGVHASGVGVACAVGDYDNDGLPDLALAMDDRVLLFRNLGGGKFEEVTKAAGIELHNHPTGLIFVDYDHDGDLDLFVTGAVSNGVGPNVLWRNNGNKTFTDWTQQAGLTGSGSTASSILSDLNNDRAVDLLVAGSGAAPTFFANRREGPFQASPLFAENLPPTVSVATLDFNKDGWMDVVLTHTGTPGVTLWRNSDGRRFERVPLPLQDAVGATGVVPIDFDNDGWIDLAVLVDTKVGPQLRMLRNLGPAGFVDVTAQLKLDKVHLKAPRSLIASDVDGDGDADLLVTEAGGSTILLRNDGGNRNHSVAIKLKGIADNKRGIGTKVEVFANGLWQKWEDIGQPEILAGLGTVDKADLVRLLWPTGVPQDEIDLSAGAPHLITELDRRGSSCPTLFAWDGIKYGFVADVIGAGVVGHWVSPTQRNIPDPDEWIKVDGSQIKERNGLFSFRFGEPMEEVNFVDQVRLVAIDHPASISVYPNEGFLSEPPFAQEKMIASSSAHPLAGAWDDQGADVLSLLRERDHSYVKDFTNLPFAGFANKHQLTLDIGSWASERPLRLLLHGFIEYFSASSMYSAWQAGLSPLPPSIEAKFPDGSWHKIVDDMGFPAGLPRTVVVDLTGKLPAGVTLLRITTNLQIYWDQILVDNGSETTTQVRQTELPIVSAQLAFRGYPQQLDGTTAGDLTYDYQHMSSTGPFIPHRGAYTRYGDVTPLLRAADDEYVIFGTGEDMDLEFSGTMLSVLPQGWTRDFFFYANGFVKDMDFYEASPFLVGALPFHQMSTYPYPDSEHYPSDSSHTAYQLEWNTRFESGSPNRQFQFHYVTRPSTPQIEKSGEAK